MSECFCKMVISRFAVVGIAVFLGIMCFAHNDAGAETKEGHGVDNVTKLKYAGPIKDIHLYLCAFHIAKNNPDFEVEVHHYCSTLGLKVGKGDIHQCVIYDSKEAPAKLLGIEYIISDKSYQVLPYNEKIYWHPHAYEIVSGQLIVPDLYDMGDNALEGFLGSWGKAFHTWPDPDTNIPMGKPLLMWSAGADGQISKEMIDKRDKEFGVSTDQLRERRKMYGYQVPDVGLPKSVGGPGRQWTSEGLDMPQKLE